MRNATIEDVKKAQATGVLEENVMYGLTNGVLIHGKSQSKGVVNTVRDCHGNDAVISETSEGELYIVFLRAIKPIETGPATTPKKQRRKPTKGTKPFKEVPFDKSLIKKGVRVRFRNGQTAKVSEDIGGEVNIGGSYLGRWYINGGHPLDSAWSIISILLPYEEQKQTNVQATPSQSDIDKQNFENGLWVPFVAIEDNSYPKWLRAEQIVEVMLGDGSTGVSSVSDVYWGREILVDCKIVAFKKP